MSRYLIIPVLMIFMVLNMDLSGQIFDYRYYESPSVSLNGFSMADSRQIAMGDISLAASGHAMQIGNPALFSDTKGVEIGFSYNFLMYQSFQYWGINEGVKRSQDPFSENKSFPGSLAVRFGYSKFSITAGWYRSALNDFPDFSFISEYDYDQSEEFNGVFNGFDESYFIAVGFSLSQKLNAGVKVEYKKGGRDVKIENVSSLYYFLEGYWQLKDKGSSYSEDNISQVIIPELGLVIDLNSKLKGSLKIRYPLKGKVDRKITRNLSNSDGLNSLDYYVSEDDHFEIPRFAAGLIYDVQGVNILGSTGRLIIGTELEYLRWSGYKFIFFGEEQPRDLVDTFKLSAGAEYSKKIKKIELLFRMGLGVDRQPVKEPGTLLMKVSAGFGMKYFGVSAGIGISYFHGSSGGRAQDHLLVCTSISKVL